MKFVYIAYIILLIYFNYLRNSVIIYINLVLCGNNMSNNLVSEKLQNLNVQYQHPSYLLEKKLLKSIKMGLLDESLQVLKLIKKFDPPKVAKDLVRSSKNLLIGSCTLFTRAAIEAGLSAEDAYDVSDAFIKQIENITSKQEADDFEAAMVKEFVELIQETTILNYPYPISKIIYYIHQNITQKLSVSSLAKMVHLSPDYLSKLFHKEVEVPLSDYIQKQKVETAKIFLEFDEMNITEISILFEFCNHGYFTNVFKKHTGQTPAAYRKNSNQIK